MMSSGQEQSRSFHVRKERRWSRTQVYVNAFQRYQWIFPDAHWQGWQMGYLWLSEEAREGGIQVIQGFPEQNWNFGERDKGGR